MIIFLFILFHLYREGIFFEFTFQLPYFPLNPSSIAQSSKLVALNDKDCDLSIWKYVYLPNRLFMIQPCVEVSGTVEGVNLEEDGDNHIYFKPDKNNPNLVNLFNKMFAGGNIIAETVCLDIKKNEKVAEESCQGYQNKIKIPQVGAHIKMKGSLVLDKGVGWIEIHPVTAIQVEN